MNSETSLGMSSFSTEVDQQAVTRTKRKLPEELCSTDNPCVKRSNNEDYFGTENCSLPTAIEAVAPNEQTVPLNTTDLQWKIEDIDMYESCTPRNENGGIEITLQNIDTIFKQISDSDIYIVYNSDFSESISLTEHSVTEFKHEDDTDYCDNDLSWLINFKTGASSKAAEIEHDHRNRGGKWAESAYSGVCKFPCPGVGLAPSCIETTETSVWCDRALPSSVGNHENSYPGDKRPPFTYVEMITKALQEKEKLTVSQIYQWISEHFPYYKPNNDRWKNCIRHNLTTNPHFSKGARAPRGAGRFWTLTSKHENFQSTLETERHEFMSNIMKADKADKVTANIEQEENQDLHREVLLSVPEEGIASYTFQDLGFEEWVSLVQSTEEILSRTEENAEVQDISPQAETTSPIEIDFLNPVPKDVAVEDLGSLGNVAGLDDMDNSLLNDLISYTPEDTMCESKHSILEFLMAS
ncbi:uncharacterized protein LOC110836366 isoform X2 [Zootermopsis nevadensis]|uniref:uncharacterized protein LOC110836366 isoform X2 n=1 Tax=Zootermopsis nevadensis TaxID=136037 RepID=UPI000B8EE509|nr:uncharacterized protein LOC110836366 isoform X2 [Zootermopsis nevadensis]